MVVLVNRRQEEDATGDEEEDRRVMWKMAVWLEKGRKGEEGRLDVLFG